MESFSFKMVKITNFAKEVTKGDFILPKAPFLKNAAICRRFVFSCGNEKRIGKDGKISCRIFLSSVEKNERTNI